MDGEGESKAARKLMTACVTFGKLLFRAYSVSLELLRGHCEGMDGRMEDLGDSGVASHLSAVWTLTLQS